MKNNFEKITKFIFLSTVFNCHLNEAFKLQKII